MQILKMVFAFVILAPVFVGPVTLVVPIFRASTPGNTDDGAEAVPIDIRAQQTPFFPNTSGGPPLFITNTFATNLGPDNMPGFSGPVDVSSPRCAGPGVCPFDIVFPLDTPFLYDSTKGRLLFDIHGVGLSAFGDIDAQFFTFPPGGSIAGLAGYLGDLTGEVEASGTITRFTFQVVPELASGALLLAGLRAVAGLRRQAQVEGAMRVDWNAAAPGPVEAPQLTLTAKSSFPGLLMFSPRRFA